MRLGNSNGVLLNAVPAEFVLATLPDYSHTGLKTGANTEAAKAA